MPGLPYACLLLLCLWREEGEGRGRGRGGWRRGRGRRRREENLPSLPNPIGRRQHVFACLGGWEGRQGDGVPTERETGTQTCLLLTDMPPAHIFAPPCLYSYLPLSIYLKLIMEGVTLYLLKLVWKEKEEGWSAGVKTWPHLG